MEIGNSKTWWQSKTVWGGLIALLAGIAGIFGYTLHPEDQNLIVEAGTSVVALVGGVIAVWGRVKASKTVGKKE